MEEEGYKGDALRNYICELMKTPVPEREEQNLQFRLRQEAQTGLLLDICQAEVKILERTVDEYANIVEEPAEPGYHKSSTEELTAGERSVRAYRQKAYQEFIRLEERFIGLKRESVRQQAALTMVTFYRQEIPYNYFSLACDRYEARLGYLLKHKAKGEARRVELTGKLGSFHAQRANEEQLYQGIIRVNLPLVVSLAKSHFNGEDDEMDIILSGNEGLARAVQDFNVDLGNSFSTYATPWIKKSIQDYFSRKKQMLRETYLGQRAMKSIQMAESTFFLIHGRNPDFEELGLGISRAMYDRAKQARVSTRIDSLQREVGSDEGNFELINGIEDESSPNPLQEIEQQELSRLVTSVLNSLPDRDREIVQMHIIEGNALEKVGNRFGVSRERIRQIVAKIMTRIRSSDLAPALKDYHQESAF